MSGNAGGPWPPSPAQAQACQDIPIPRFQARSGESPLERPPAAASGPLTLDRPSGTSPFRRSGTGCFYLEHSKPPLLSPPPYFSKQLPNEAIIVPIAMKMSAACSQAWALPHPLLSLFLSQPPRTPSPFSCSLRVYKGSKGKVKWTVGE